MRNSGLGLIDDVYFLRVEVGPAGLQDCKRELPQAIRAALVQHAEDLGLDRDVTARIQVPDELLLKSVRDQWPQQSLIRRVSQPAGHDDNAIQYVLVGLDAATRQRIRMDVEQTVVRERLAAGAVIVAGVLGLLGLAWVGLKLAAGKAQ